MASGERSIKQYLFLESAEFEETYPTRIIPSLKYVKCHLCTTTGIWEVNEFQQFSTNTSMVASGYPASRTSLCIVNKKGPTLWGLIS